MTRLVKSEPSLIRRSEDDDMSSYAAYRSLLAAKGVVAELSSSLVAGKLRGAKEEAQLRESRLRYAGLLHKRLELTHLRRSRQGLSESEKKEAMQILSVEEAYIIQNRFNTQITVKVVKCLRPGEWLNDEVINFYMNLLNERNAKLRGLGQDVPYCFCWNSFFWTKLCSENGQSYDYSQVKRWSKKRQLDVFKLDLMCVPVNVRNVHWALGVVNFRLKKITFLDSFQSNIPPREFYAGICRYLHDEHIDKKGLPLTKGWVFDSNLYSPVPQQNNGSDCGVFTCQFGECLSDGRFLDFTQKNIPNLRLKMVRILFFDMFD